MNIPIFEKPSSLVLFIGIGGLLLLFSSQIKSAEVRDEKEYDGDNKTVQLECDFKLDSIAILALQNKLIDSTSLSVDSSKSRTGKWLSERKKIEYQITEKTIVNERRIKEIKIIRDDINNRYLQYEVYTNTIYPIILLIACGLLIVIGIFLLFKEHEETNSIKQGSEINSGICQSCGMGLQYDTNAYADKKFCSTCYDGTNFTEPELTLKELQKRVEDNLRKQGFSSRAIKKHNKTVSKLNRWVKTLRWQTPK